jgi:hypothetical protein
MCYPRRPRSKNILSVLRYPPHAIVSIEGHFLQLSKMDSSKVLSLLEQLDDEIDDLEESLEPLLQQALSETSSTLPLLDKAKLFVLVTYAIESMLFCKCYKSTCDICSNTYPSISATQRRQGTRASGVLGTY